MRIYLLIFYFLLVSGFSSAQNSFIKLAGRTTDDIYSNIDETSDGGVVFGGAFGIHYCITRCTNAIDTLWTRIPDSPNNWNINNLCAMYDGRLACSGTHVNNGYNEAALIVFDSAGNFVANEYFPSGYHGMWGRDVYAMPDSGVMLKAIEDGMLCSNYMEYFRRDKSLDPFLFKAIGTCDSYVNNAKGYNRVSDRMNFLRVYEYYFDTITNGFYSAPEVITVDGSFNGVLDTVYNIYQDFISIENCSDGGGILYGLWDTLGSVQVRLVRISANGAIQWIQTIGNFYDDYPEDVVETNDQGFVVLSTQYLPGTYTATDLGFYKLDSLGQLQFYKSYGSNGTESAVEMIKKRDGSLLILGRTDGFGAQRNMIIQLDSTGVLNPTYRIQAAADHFCAGDSALLTVAPPAMHYQWSTGDTSSSLWVKTAGNYQLTVIDSSGNTHEVPFLTIYFDAPPNTQLNDTAFYICEGQSANVSVSPANGNEYKWFYNGVFMDTVYYCFVDAWQSGNYSVIVSNACGTDTSSEANVTVYPNPQVPQVAASPSEHTCNSPVVLTTQYTNHTIHWKWSGNDFVQDTLVLTGLARYFLSITATDTNNCTSQAKSLYVTINDIPQIDFNNSAQTVCTPGSVALPYTASAVYGNFIFIRNGTAIDTFNYSAGISAYNSGIYTMVMANACSADSDSVYVTEYPKPVIDIFPDTAKICSGIPVLVMCLTPGIYEWNQGWTGSSKLISTTGYNFVRVTDTVTGCLSVKTIVVINSSDPSPAISPLPDTLLCQFASFEFYPGNFNSYQWNTGSTDSALTLINPGINDTLYLVVITIDSNNCSVYDSATVVFNLCNGINDEKSPIDLMVYPNPTTGLTVFEFKTTLSNDEIILNLFDVTGKKLLKKTFTGNKTTIDTREFSATQIYYVVQVENWEYRGIIQIIK